MSSFSHIRLKKSGVARIRDYDYGQGYSSLSKFLDAVASELGVQSPLTFEYEDAELYEDIGIPADLCDAPKPQVEWHDPSDGLAAFTRILDYVRALSDEKFDSRIRASGVRGGMERAVMIFELECFRRILERAVKGKDLFRIEPAG